MTLLRGQRGMLDLQTTLSAASVTSGPDAVKPHHPITCRAELRLEDDGSLACEHSAVPSDDTRTRHCIDHSVAVLLIELAGAL